jgi:hypothetical protein
MGKKAALLLGLALSTLLAFAQDESGGLIEGESWAFLISAPDGWVLDNITLHRQGTEGLFYKKGTEFSPDELHMYIRPTAKKPGGTVNLREFIQADEASLYKSAASPSIKELSPYSTSMEYSFVLRDFDDRDEGFYKAIAYFEGEEGYFTFVLSCRSALERDRERVSFRDLLDSFTYIRKE